MRPHRRTEAASPGGPRIRPGGPRIRPGGPRIRPGGLRSCPAGSHGPANAPDYPEVLLVCEASSTTLADGRWRFSIESADGDPVLEAADEEAGDLNRLTLLAAVRGLEAIDGPASVMLLSTNRYLIRSLAESLPRWRAHDFAWEHFGRVIEIQHADLWRRIDRAVRIHRVEACLVSSRLVSPGRLRAEMSPAANPAPIADHSASPPPHLSAEIASDRSDVGEPMWRIDAPHTPPHRRKQAQPGPETHTQPGPETHAQPGPATHAQPGPETHAQPGPETHAQPGPETHATQTDRLRRLLLGHPVPRSQCASLSNDESLPNAATAPDHAAPRDHAATPARRRGQRRRRFTAADLMETG